MRTRGHSPVAIRPRRRTNIIPRLDVLEDRRLMAVAFVETPFPAPAGGYIHPLLVTHASDGAVWTISGVGDLAEASPSSIHATRTDPQGVMTDVPGLPASENPVALFAGDRGSVWAVTDAHNGTGHIVRLATTFSITANLPAAPLSATLGADGDVWITTFPTGSGDSHSISRFDPRTGVITPFALPGGSTKLGPIITANDGNLWTIEPDAKKVVKVTPAGQITEYLIPIKPWTIAAGAGGGVWVAGSDAGGNPVIAQVTSGGTATIATTLAQPLPYFGPSAAASSMAAAPDGSLWFINEYQEAIGHLKSDGSLDYFPQPETSRTFHLSLTTDGATGFYFTHVVGSEFVHLLTDAPEPGVLLTAKSIEHVEGPLPAGLTIATFTTTDATAFPFDFIARYQIANQLPQVGTVLSDGRGGFVVQTSGMDPVQQPGSQFLSVTVLDVKHNNSIGAKSSGIGLVKIDDSPVTITGLSVSATAGVAYTGAVATLTDPDGGVAGDVPTQATINWGDGGSSSATVTPSSSSATNVAVPVGHVYATAGSYPITITANHGGTISSGTSTVTVGIPAITSITPVTAGFSQGHRSDTVVASFQTASESVANNYTTGVDWLPNYLKLTKIVQVGPTSFDVVAGAVFSSWGEQRFSVYVAPSASHSPRSYVEVDAIVTPAPVTASTLPIEVEPAGGTLFGTGRGPVASFTSGNPQATATDFRATISSSDGGSWRSSVVADNGGGFLVEGDHRFPVAQTAGTFVVTIKIDNFLDSGQVANAATLSSSVTVFASTFGLGRAEGDTATTPVGQGWIGYIGSFVPTDQKAQTSDFTATVHWDDGTPDSPAQNSPLGGGPFLIGVGHVFSIVGDRIATIDIVSNTGEHATATATFHVLPPPFLATGAALAGTQGTTISGVVATFHDATPSAPSAYSSTIDWGDGTLSPGTVSTYQDAFVVFGSHVYATAGPHAYGLVIQENGGTPVTATGTVMVAATDPIPKPIGTPAGGGPAGGGPMTIVSARSIRNKHGFIRVVVTLSGTVDTTAVTNAARYMLTEPGKPGKHATKDKIDKIASTTYDPSTKTLTLVPKGTFRRPVAFRVGVVGSASVMALAS